jgi:hypothetical protein
VLPFDVSKCQVMSFTFTIGSLTLELVVSIANLGVILNSKLSFRYHINATIAKGLTWLGFHQTFAQ